MYKQLAAALMLGLCVQSASALKFDIQGDIAVVTGDLEPQDSGRFSDAIKKGVKTFVARDLRGGGYIDQQLIVGNSLAGEPITMVVDGPCFSGCAIIVAAARQRVFAKPEAGEKAGYVLMTGPIYTALGGLPAPSIEQYTYYTERLPESFPRSLLNKVFAQNASTAQGAVVLPPTSAAPAGQLLFCADLKNVKSCVPEKDTNAVASGFLTSNQLFELPEAVKRKKE